MKTYFILFLFITLSLNVALGQNRNWNYSAKLLTIQELYMSIDGEPYTGDQFPIKSKAKLVFEGVEGFQLQNGKVFPKMALIVKDSQSGEVVMENENLLQQYVSEGISLEDSKYLTSLLTVGKPLELDKKYTWNIIISDIYGKGRLNVSYDFQVAPPKEKESAPTDSDADEEAFTYDTDGLNIEGVYLNMDGNGYFETDLPINKTINMIFKEVNGFAAINGKVFPGMAIRVTDLEGNIMLIEKDLFAQYATFGVDPIDAQTITSKLKVAHPMQLDQNYIWEVHIWDREWPKNAVDAVLEFKVIE